MLINSLLTLFSYLIKQFLSIIPSKTRVGDGFTVNHIRADLLVAFFEVTFDHYTFDKFVKIRIIAAAVKNLACNSYLLLELLVGIRVVGIDNCGRILEILSHILFIKSLKIFIMVIRNANAVFVDTAT